MPGSLSRIRGIITQPVSPTPIRFLPPGKKSLIGSSSADEVAAERVSVAADFLDDFLADADVTDGKGTKLTKGQKSRAVAESIAYSGLSINELVSGRLSEGSMAKWATEDRPTLSGELGNRLDFSGVDILNTPVEEALALLPYIIYDGDDNPTGLREAEGLSVTIRRLETLLPKFGMPIDDASILRFVERQYRVMSTLRPETYKPLAQ
jgi:hypothetical protein